MKTTVLVTGSDGQIGRSLTIKLKQHSDITLFTTNRSTLDISNATQVDVTIKSIKPDVIINAAAYTAEDEVALSCAINSDGCKYLAQAAQNINAILPHISTDYVFGGGKAEPYTENDIPNPLSIYGKSKLAGKKEITSYCSKYAILLTAWAFSGYGSNFVKTICKLCKVKSELSIVADQYGDFTYAGDINSALITIIVKMRRKAKCKSDMYHFSGMPYTNWFAFSQSIFSLAKKWR